MYQNAGIKPLIFLIILVVVLCPLVDATAGDTLFTNATKGGVFNGGFETGTGTVTAASPGWIGSHDYGWLGGISTADTNVGTVMYDANISHSGSKSMKFTMLTTSLALYYINPSDVLGAAWQKDYIPIKPSTRYKLSGWIKSTGGINDGSYVRITCINSTYGYNAANVSSTTNITGTYDWTPVNITFTSDPDATWGFIGTSGYYQGNTGATWFDDITLEEVHTETYGGASSVRVYPVVQGVTSTDNIDQSSLSSQGFFAIGDYSGTQYQIAQSFVPSKSELTSVTLFKGTGGGTPTGDIQISIVTNNAGVPGTTTIASKNVTAANWALQSNGEVVVSLPSILNVGTPYWIMLRDGTRESSNVYYQVNISTAGMTGPYPNLTFSTNGGSTYANSTSSTYFKTNYAKNTEQVNVTVNGNTTVFDTDSDMGILPGMTIDTYKGMFNWTPTNKTWVLGVSAATPGGRTTDANVLNGWYADITNIGPGYAYSGTANRYVYWKVATILPAKQYDVSTLFYVSAAGTKHNLSVSTDNSTWTPIIEYTGDTGVLLLNASTTACLDKTVCYFRMGRAASESTAIPAYVLYSINGTLNTTDFNPTHVQFYKPGTNLVNISSNGDIASAGHDPSLMVNLSLVEGVSGGSAAVKPIAISSLSRNTIQVGGYTWRNDTSLNTPTAWCWTFGDGTFGNTANGSKFYTRRGIYNISSNVSNSAGFNISYNIMRVV